MYSFELEMYFCPYIDLKTAIGLRNRVDWHIYTRIHNVYIFYDTINNSLPGNLSLILNVI